jgi:hypothetical protein
MPREVEICVSFIPHYARQTGFQGKLVSAACDRRRLHTIRNVFVISAPSLQQLHLLLEFVCHIYKHARNVDIYHACTYVQLGMSDPDMPVFDLDSDWF